MVAGAQNSVSPTGPTEGEPIISIQNLVVRYDDRVILDNVNLDILRGETMVLLGGSGSGKSTLLRHIIGLEKPASGRILVKGVDVANTSNKHLNEIRRAMGVSFQSAALFNSMTLADNIALPLREHTDLAEPTIDVITRMKLAQVGLAQAENLYPAQLSGGMRKRAAVARATALDPEILLFDEPSAGLDPIVAAGIDELVMQFRKVFHMTIVVVTHELASAFLIADRICMLYRGKMIAVGTKEEIESSQHPRVRQFLDRIPDPVEDAAETFLKNLL